MNTPSRFSKLRPPSVINASCLIDVTYENYPKILGVSKKDQNHSVHSVSCLINKASRTSSCSMPSLKCG